jgi:hypothetical protein
VKQELTILHRGGEQTWHDILCRRVEPTEEQARLIAAVETALGEGLFYSNEVKARVKDLVPFSDAALNSRTRNVEGGDAGYEIYLAREVVERRKEEAAIAEAAKRVQFKEGDKIKNLRIGGDRFSTATVTKVTDGGHYELSLVKRGTKNRWKATLNALGIERATKAA